MSLDQQLISILSPDKRKVGSVVRVGENRLTISTKEGSILAEIPANTTFVVGDRVVLDPMNQISQKLSGVPVPTYVV